MGVGLRLKEALRIKSLTIKQLAEASGVSVNTLYSITKRDSERVDDILLQRIAAALGVTVDYLMGRGGGGAAQSLGLRPGAKAGRCGLLHRLL